MSTSYNRRVVRTLTAVQIVLVLALIALAILSVLPQAARAQVRVPDVSPLHRLQIEAASARYMGLQAQPSKLAAQIHQESAWKHKAQSHVGAQGLAQFMPRTAEWLPQVCPEIGPPDPWNPSWSLYAQSCYMGWLFKRTPTIRGGGPLDTCSRWAFALRSYNGGEGWLLKERMRALAGGADPNAWHAVEPFRVRAGWAHKENIGYPIRILRVIEPAYLAAGWPGGPACR